MNQDLPNISGTTAPADAEAVSYKLRLADCPVYIINLDESRSRWVQTFRRFSALWPAKKIIRVTAINGRDFADAQRAGQWRPEILKQLRRERYLADDPLPDPIRTALCLSHQRALRMFLESAPKDAQAWALILEDDARPAEKLLSHPSQDLELLIPSEAEVIFLHDRVLTDAQSAPPVLDHQELPFVHWRPVTGGIGLEGYLVSKIGARKMLAAWKPLHFECDVQLMAFAHHYADLYGKKQLWSTLGLLPNQHERTLKCYAPSRPFIQIDENEPSVKFGLLDEIHQSASTKDKPHLALNLNQSSPIAFATCWFNPSHFRSRLENFVRFRERLQDCNLAVIELAFNDDDWQLPDDTPNLIRLRSDSVCWQKEALLNYGLNLLEKHGFPYLGWLDADVVFDEQDWQEQVVETLQTKKLCQVFETVDTTFPDRGPERSTSAAASWLKHAQSPTSTRVTGFGWAMQREVWTSTALFDLSLLGGGDHVMWRSAFYGFLESESLFGKSPYPKTFSGVRRAWAEKWSRAIGMSIGYARGMKITSLPHGREQDRQYSSRGSILSRHGFDPELHVKRDHQGLLKWHDDTPSGLVSDVREYFASRKEDLVS